MKKRSGPSSPAAAEVFALKNYAKVIAALLLWSTWGIAVKKLHIDSFYILFFTTLFSLPAVALVAGLKSFPNSPPWSEIRPQLPLIALLAGFLLANNFFYFAAFNRTSIAISVFTHYTAPLFVAVMAPMLLGEAFEIKIIPPLLLALAGLLAILFPGFNLNLLPHDFSGALCGLASGFFYALTLITAKHLTGRTSLATIIFGQNIFIVLFLLPFFLYNHKIAFPPSSWILLAGLGVTLCGLAPFSYLSGLRRIKAQHVAIIGYLEPLSAVALGLLVSRRSPSLSIWFGGAAILVSGALVTILRKN